MRILRWGHVMEGQRSRQGGTHVEIGHEVVQAGRAWWGFGVVRLITGAWLRHLANGHFILGECGIDASNNHSQSGTEEGE